MELGVSLMLVWGGQGVGGAEPAPLSGKGHDENIK